MESDGAGTTRLRGGPGSHGQCPANRSAGSGSGGWKCELPAVQAAPPGKRLGAADRLVSYDFPTRRMNQVLARSEHWTVTNEYEVAYAEREDGFRVCVSYHYGDPSCAVIAHDESWVAVGGEGVTVYFLRPPFEDYAGRDGQNTQHHEFLRGSQACHVEALYQHMDHRMDELRVVVDLDDPANGGVYSITLNDNAVRVLWPGTSENSQ